MSRTFDGYSMTQFAIISQMRNSMIARTGLSSLKRFARLVETVTCGIRRQQELELVSTPTLTRISLPEPASPMGDRAVDKDAIDRAAALIKSGKLVAFPTETVYGLGGDATSNYAVANIFAAKGRPLFNPLIIHVGEIAQALEFVVMDNRAKACCAVPGLTPLPSASPVTPQHSPCWRLRGGQSRHPAPIVPAASAQRPPRMCGKNLRVVST